MYACLGECSSIDCSAMVSLGFKLQDNNGNSIIEVDSLMKEDIRLYPVANNELIYSIYITGNYSIVASPFTYEELILELEGYGTYPLKVKYHTSETKCCGTDWEVIEVYFNDKLLSKNDDNFYTFIIP